MLDRPGTRVVDRDEGSSPAIVLQQWGQGGHLGARVLGDLQYDVGEVAGQGPLHLDAPERLEADVHGNP